MERRIREETMGEYGVVTGQGGSAPNPPPACGRG